MRSCPSCGAPAKPVDKFCGQCGAQLGTVTEIDGNEQTPRAPAFSKKVLIVILATGIIIAIAVGAIFLKSEGNATGNPVAANRTPSSYVIIETEAPLPAISTTPLITATPSPTAIPTTVTTPKHSTCPTDRRLCGTNCTDTLTDSSNCGYCGNACPRGQACVNGHCMLDCPAGKTACVEGCFNLETDPDHCGICSNNCPAGLVCSKGQCAPPPTTINRAL
ncbi:zinc-ribbon domain-containing protein [Methanoregula formicica]|uniref:Stigma-specific protein, Stig1 n=1 Tax=Methanoregula formicica (strain DSM 22288 / NBRC 105244 / SMSP) TaxID=593750 RepID=L0HDE7_METFS|nr:zinc ribbon domain-containing protein [Methanoregula formicica]AGB02732.1 Stigma-specific protein, Stig1 [Methanoregula formicica SMSP]